MCVCVCVCVCVCGGMGESWEDEYSGSLMYTNTFEQLNIFFCRGGPGEGRGPNKATQL